jgi:tetratricopeptide (TPR) repeat protein
MYFNIEKIKFGILDDAIEQYRTAIRILPGEGHLHQALGRLLVHKKGRADEAMTEYRRAIDACPSDDDLRWEFALSLVQLGKNEEAIDHLKNSKTGRMPYMLLGHLLRKAGKRDDAFAAFEQSLLHEGGMLSIQLECLHDTGTQEKELELFWRACRTQPGEWGLLGEIGKHMREHGLANQEVELFQVAVRRKPDVAGTRHLLADALDRVGRYEESDRQYREAFRLGPKDGTIRAAYGESLVRRGKLSEAVTAFREAVRLVPEDPVLRQQLGVILAKAGHRDEAKAAIEFAKLLDLLPEDRGYGSPRSRMILDMARWDRAYAKLLELRPNDDHLWTGRGRYYALRSQWDRAAADFARGIKSAPPASEEWFEHACLRLIVGDREGYRTFVQELRRREGQTNNPLMAYVLARSCVVTNDPVVEPEQIIRWAEQAVRNSRLPWYLHALGTAHYRAGHLDEAITLIEESNSEYALDEYKFQNRLVLAMAHQRLGHVQQARVLLEEVQRSWERIEAARTDGAVSLFSPDWLALQLLRREAEAVILYDPVFPADPFAH